MIIGAALALACGLAANLLLRMITIGLKNLLDSSGNGDPSSGGSGGEWKGFILSGSALKPGRASQKIQRIWKLLSSSLPHPPPMGRQLFLAAIERQR